MTDGGSCRCAEVEDLRVLLYGDGESFENGCGKFTSERVP